MRLDALGIRRPQPEVVIIVSQLNRGVVVIAKLFAPLSPRQCTGYTRALRTRNEAKRNSDNFKIAKATHGSDTSIIAASGTREGHAGSSPGSARRPAAVAPAYCRNLHQPR